MVRSFSLEQEQNPVPSDVSATASWSWLLLIMGIALVLRCAFISRQSLWVDEAQSWWFASDLGRALASERTNPPLYYTTLHFWIGWFGHSEAALRSLSVVPGVLSVGLVYVLAKKLLTRGIALGAALYQSISSFQIYYSQEVRTFAFLEFFLLMAALALWNALESGSSESGSARRRLLYFSGYTLAGAFSLYAHFIAIFFLAGFGVFVLLCRRRQLVPFLASSVVTMLLFLPWLMTLLRAASGGGQQMRRYLLLKLPQAYFSFLFGDSLIPLDNQAVTHIRQTLLQFAPLLLVAILSVIALLPFVWRAWKRWGDQLLYVMLSASVPVLLAFLVSFKVMLFDERYLIAAAPFLYITVGAAVAEVLWWRRELGPDWRTGLTLAAVGLYSVLLLVSLYNYYFTPRFGREQWRDAVAYIESQDSGKTVIVFDASWLLHCYDYYQKRGFPHVAITESADLSQLAGYDSVWLIRSHSDSAIVQDLLATQLQRDSSRTYSNGDGIEVSHFHPQHP
jgi:mannosyltransferase